MCSCLFVLLSLYWFANADLKDAEQSWVDLDNTGLLQAYL